MHEYTEMTDSEEVVWTKYERELWEESERDMKMYIKIISMRLVIGSGVMTISFRQGYISIDN